jgi:hypothetical protein
VNIARTACSSCVDHSPGVHLRTPIKTRDTRTFRGIGEAAMMRALLVTPGVHCAPGFLQGTTTPRL